LQLKRISLGLCELIPDSLADSLHTLAQSLLNVVLPDPDYTVPKRLQSLVDYSISASVSSEFLFPEASIRLRRSRVQRAAVPETTIDEDGQVRTWEQQIRLARKTRVDPVPEASVPQCGPQCTLWPGVFGAHCRHATSALFRLQYVHTPVFRSGSTMRATDSG